MRQLRGIEVTPGPFRLHARILQHAGGVEDQAQIARQPGNVIGGGGDADLVGEFERGRAVPVQPHDAGKAALRREGDLDGMPDAAARADDHRNAAGGKWRGRSLQSCQNVTRTPPKKALGIPGL